jgi:hypothetical protein
MSKQVGAKLPPNNSSGELLWGCELHDGWFVQKALVVADDDHAWKGAVDDDQSRLSCLRRQVKNRRVCESTTRLDQAV